MRADVFTRLECNGRMITQDKIYLEAGFDFQKASDSPDI